MENARERAYLIRKAKRLRVILDSNDLNEIEEFKYQEMLYMVETQINNPELRFNAV